MRQNIFYLTVFIIIFGLMAIGTVDAATITENFDSDPGWQSVNLPVNNSDFGFRNSNFAGGNTGEAGGFFSRTDQVSWYGNDTIGNFTGNKILSASGLMNINNVEPGYNNSIHVGHFDSGGPPHINGIGFQILEYPVNSQTINPSSFRIFYEIGDTQGPLFIITGINESRTWSYLYDPNDGSYGSLTVSISGTGGNTAKVFLSESQRNSIGTLNTFGLAEEGGLGSAPEKCEFYIDNVSYTVDVDSELLYTAVPPCRIVDTRLAGGLIPPDGVRSYNVYGDVASQGGNPAGCPSPKGEPLAVALNVTAVPVLGGGPGHLTAYPYGSTAPLASLVNYKAGVQNIANSGTVKTCQDCTKDISVKSGVGYVNVVIDVLGYYFAKP